MNPRVTDLAIFANRGLPNDQTIYIVIVRKEDVKKFHGGLGSSSGISESKAAGIHALDRYFTDEKGIADNQQMMIEVLRILPGCTIEEYGNVSDIFDNFAPEGWEGPVYSVFWITDTKTGKDCGKSSDHASK